MTRTLLTAVLTSILLTNSLAAQDTPKPADQDPVASLTARIMSQIFSSRMPVRPVLEPETDLDEPAETLPWMTDSMRAMPSAFWMMPPATTKLPSDTPSWNSMSRQMTELTRMSRQTVSEDTPLAFSAANVNGKYAIEAVVPTDRGPEKVQLNGTRLEVEDQFKALPTEVRRALGPSLGM